MSAKLVLHYDDGQRLDVPLTAVQDDDTARKFVTGLRDAMDRRRQRPFYVSGDRSGLVIATRGLRLAVLAEGEDE